ncbi:MAG: AtzH-like domain-containing protein [Acidimicrobiales bacterium]
MDDITTRQVEESVARAMADYDDALSAGDLDRVDGWFWPTEGASRLGESGSIHGAAAIADARRGGAAPSSPRSEVTTRIVALTAETAVSILEYVRPETGRRGRRTQVWLLTPDGWRIAHAHLSLEA